MAKSRRGITPDSNDKELQDLKSSIGVLTVSTKDLQSNIDGLSSVIKNDLIKAISGLKEETKTNTNEKKKRKTGPRKEEFNYQKQLTNMFNGIGGSFSKNLTKLFGEKRVKGAIKNLSDTFNSVAPQKKLSEKQVKAGFGGKKAKENLLGGKMGDMPGGKNPFKMVTGKAFDGLQKAGQSLIRGGAGLIRAAGPIGAAFAIGKEVFDFFNSGEAAKAVAKIGAVLGKDTTEATKATFMMSERYREIQADFNIIKPVERENQKRMDMLEFQKSAEMDRMGFSQQLVKDEYNRRFENEKDWLNFAHSQAVANVDAEHERRKTLFMTGMKSFEKYIGVGERALNAIGSSTEAVLNSITSIGKNLGASVGEMISMSAAAAGVSKLLGSSAEEVLSMGNMFRLMNKTTLKVGTNLTTGIKAFADKNGVMASVIMKDMTDSSAEIYKFSSGTAENFAKQAIALNKMGTSMNAMMKASDAMVLNYKDSIKAEMGLSAMLGKNVDLSETRAKLMAGDQAGAAESLRGALGGMDVGTMNAFQKQQLSQATGMDIDQLMSLQQGGEGGVKGTLDEKNAKKTGADIAKGALQQDIANEAKKIGMEQAFRAKMLKFEQDERKGMLMIEQMQRLENLAIEQKWRIKFAEAEKQGTLDMEIAKMQAEGAKSAMANIFNDAALDYRNTINKDASLTAGEIAGKFQAFQAENEKAQGYINKLIDDGVITSNNAQATIVDIAQGIAKGQTYTTEQINQMLAQEGAFEKAVNQKQAELNAKQEELAKAETKAKEESLSWWESGLASVGAFMGSFMEDQDFFGYGAADITAEKEANDKLSNLQAEMKGMNTNVQEYKNLSQQYTPNLKTIAQNDDTRGQVFKKQYDYQAQISNEGVKAQYANVAATEALAAAMGKPVQVDGNGIKSVINRSSYVSYQVG